ncbi:MAG: N-acetylmuramoyl-L-alanine amidase [Oscillospiraceae bacterium]
MKRAFLLRTIAAGIMVFALFYAALAYAGVGAQKTEQVMSYNARGGINLVIDAGHGGEDGGAVSITGTPESVINLSIALKVEQLAAFYGVAPVMTRESDEIDYPEDAVTTRARKVADQKNRVALINSTENAVLISIHQNKYTTAGPRGCQVFFSPTEGSSGFAEYLQALFLNNTDSGNRSSAAQIPDSIYLMNAVDCPAVLIECGFISNTKEAYLLEEKDYQIKLAVLIAGGFAGYSENLAEVYTEA